VSLTGSSDVPPGERRIGRLYFLDHLRIALTILVMAETQYAAYLFHVPVIVLLQFAVVHIALAPLAKFLLVTALGVPLTFLVASWIRRPALLRRIL